MKGEDIKLFRTVFCLGKKLQPSDMINTFLQLQSLNLVNLQYQNLSWDSIKGIQSCISDTIQRSINEAVLNSQFYGILLDESTDISVQKHLSICIRYVLNGEPVTKFLTNVSLDDGKAHTIVNVTVKCLEDFGINISAGSNRRCLSNDWQENRCRSPIKIQVFPILNSDTVYYTY